MTTKSKAPNYLSHEFIEELESKTYSYFFDASQFKSAEGSRRPKCILGDRVFRAIANIRHRGALESFIREVDARPKHDCSSEDEDTKRKSILIQGAYSTMRELLKNSTDPDDEQALAQFVVNAVRQGNIAELKDFVRKCKLYETKTIATPRERQKDAKSWRYYAGTAALRFLSKGVVPTKKEVREQAVMERAVHESLRAAIEIQSSTWEKDFDQKLEFARRESPSQREWTRIFKDLGLSELPTAPTH